ncbi:hypothetical protein [Mycobacterium sp. SMC-17]|uniref:hypothetical protein n=1 Tax=Mycobacterium sp. SMC-17 TaxID=3381628 RepID=UPI003876854F
MAKTTNTTEVLRTYHLAERLRGIASDALYSSFVGVEERKPIDGFIVTAHQVAHWWGYSTHVRALSAAGELVAAAEAAAAHPLPASIRSRVRTFRTGPLTWQHTAGQITSSGTDTNPSTRFVATGNAHYYELHSTYDMDTVTRSWELYIDSQQQERRFAGPTGAADFVIDQYEAGR